MIGGLATSEPVPERLIGGSSLPWPVPAYALTRETLTRLDRIGNPTVIVREAPRWMARSVSERRDTLDPTRGLGPEELLPSAEPRSQELSASETEDCLQVRPTVLLDEEIRLQRAIVAKPSAR